MKNIAIIPARGGSKRIKNKNIKLFYGKPIIQRTFEIIKKSKIFDEIYISTESNKIIRVCKSVGLKSFIRRPKTLSGHKVGIREVMQHAIKKLDKKIDIINVCCIFPCSPFLNVKNLKKALLKVNLNKKYLVHAVSRFSHPPERRLLMKKNGILSPYNEKNMSKNTQSFSPSYYDLGQFYFSHKSVWFNSSKNVKRVGIEISNWESVDIDNIDDWSFAEKLFKFKKSKTLYKQDVY